MKKFWTLFLAAVLSLNLFAACGKTPADSVGSSTADSSSVQQEQSSTHEHVFADTWKRSTTAHWRECSCGEKTDYDKHQGGEVVCGEKLECSVCGKSYGSVKEHDYAEKVKVEGVWNYKCGDCGDEMAMTDFVDFIVDVEAGKNPVILQLSDTQLTSTNQSSNENSCYKYVRETVAATKPDLILITGDLVYGRFDNRQGTMFTQFVAFMESLNIPWAPVFGNHDNECWMGVDWQCEQLENAENCLFKQGTVTGNSNYTVGILQGEILTRVFYMMDSNGCSRPMVDGITNGYNDDQLIHNTPAYGTNQVQKEAGLTSDQVVWMKGSAELIKTIEPQVKFSVAYHIQPYVFEDAFKKYSYDSNTISSNPIDIDTLENKEDGDFGFIGRALKGPWDYGKSIYNTMVEAGVDSFFVGHEHCNSASIVYNGLRFQFGQKSSTCDRYNVLTAAGKIVDNGKGSGTPLVGGTAFTLGMDGTITNPYIYLCGNPLNRNPKAV